MSRRRPAGRVRTGRAEPRVEGLEAREVPSSYAGVIARGQILAAHRVAAEAVGTAATPTPREAAREVFVAKFRATYSAGPPQFTDEARHVFFHGVGGSNQLLRADALVVINTPSDPARATTRATANIFGRDVATTGTDLVLDLAAPPSGDASSLPTQLSWTINGASAGSYSGATTPADPNNPGQVLSGTLRIVYHPSKAGAGGNSSGVADLIFKGSIITTGVGNIGVAYGTTR